MKTFSSFLAVAVLLCFSAPAVAADTGQAVGGASANGLCSRYIAEAKSYRSANRYELARQSYAQAISVCQREKEIEEAKQGLNTIELLLRTMR